MSTNRYIPDEFEQYAVKRNNGKNSFNNIKKESSDEFEQYAINKNISSQDEDESLLSSIGKAPVRILGDLGNAALNFLGNVPEYYEKSKTELPKVYNTINQHPRSAVKQGAAGLLEGMGSLWNIPSDLLNYTSNRLHLAPKELAEKFPRIGDVSPEINTLFGKPEYPGEETLRSITENIPNILAFGKTAKALNPLQYTDKAILKHIIKTESKNKRIYLGEYGDLFGDARNRGMGNVNINPNSIDINTLNKYTPSPHKKLLGLNNFLVNPTIENGQKAISDLGKIIRPLEGKAHLNEAENAHLSAANKASNLIQENMFRDSTGKLHEDLLKRHKDIQRGYANEVIPYTGNKSLQKYKSGKKLPNETVSSLKKGEFAAQRGKYHPSLKRQDWIKKALLGIGGIELFDLLRK